MKHGTRVYPLNSDRILVKQTEQKAGNGGGYTLSVDGNGTHPERHVRENDDAGIARPSVPPCAANWADLSEMTDGAAKAAPLFFADVDSGGGFCGIIRASLINGVAQSGVRRNRKPSRLGPRPAVAEIRRTFNAIC